MQSPWKLTCIEIVTCGVVIIVIPYLSKNTCTHQNLTINILFGTETINITNHPHAAIIVDFEQLISRIYDYIFSLTPILLIVLLRTLQKNRIEICIIYPDTYPHTHQSQIPHTVSHHADALHARSYAHRVAIRNHRIN